MQKESTFGQKRCKFCGRRFPDDQLFTHGCVDPFLEFADQVKSQPPVQTEIVPLKKDEIREYEINGVEEVKTEEEKEKEFNDI